jgi:hypothetical protein
MKNTTSRRSCFSTKMGKFLQGLVQHFSITDNWLRITTEFWKNSGTLLLHSIFPLIKLMRITPLFEDRGNYLSENCELLRL